MGTDMEEKDVIKNNGTPNRDGEEVQVKGYLQLMIRVKAVNILQ
jgi:hypothetical protein